MRATEYTVGDLWPSGHAGAAAPRSSGYTYAAELSVDEAVAAGTTEVRFDQAAASLRSRGSSTSRSKELPRT